jgi:hypothetical protein
MATLHPAAEWTTPSCPRTHSFHIPYFAAPLPEIVLIDGASLLIQMKEEFRPEVAQRLPSPCGLQHLRVPPRSPMMPAHV